jgi:large subunit ribosomal protein L33
VAKLKRKERNVLLECTSCKSRNYTTPFIMKGGKRLDIKKYCSRCGKHVAHKSRRMD